MTETIDTANLRALAEAATPGPWFHYEDPVKKDQFNRVRFQVVATGRTIVQTYYSSGHPECPAKSGGPDNRFIAAANPTTIIALLDRLAAAEARNATLTDDAARVVDDMCARIKAADDAAADADYMLGSDDCIKVLRGQWGGAPKRGNPDWTPDPERVAKVVDNLVAARAAASISTKGDGP